MTFHTTSGTQTAFLKSGFGRIRLSLLLGLSTVFIVLLFIVIAGLWLRHGDVTREARRHAENLVGFLSEDMAIRIRSIDDALLELSAFSRSIGGPTESGHEWMTLLRTAAAGRHGFEALMVTDADGSTTFSSLPILMGESRADGVAFGAFSQNPRNDALIANDPVRSSNDSKLVVPLARVIRTPQSEFEGIAIANFAPDQLRELYGSIDAGDNGVAWLLKPPQSVLLREPPSDARNDEPWPPALADAVSAGQAGIVIGAIESGGPDYFTAYRSFEETGLTVAVSLSLSDLFMPWWNEVYAAIAIVLLAGVILLVAAIMITRTTRAGEAILDEIAQTGETNS